MKLDESRIAILATNGFEQAELFEPKAAMEEAGALVDVIGLEAGEIKAWDTDDWGETIPVDITLEEVNVDDYDALILPGGVINPDKLRIEPSVIKFVKSFVESGKPIAAICHGPWTLIETGALEGRTVTSWPSLETDLRNAGANWEDREVVVDGQFITSRKPDDLPAFINQIKEMISGLEFNETEGNRISASNSFDQPVTLQ